MNDKINLIIVDDYLVVRDGIKLLLSGVKDVQVIGEASNAEELLELLLSKQPEVLIMDIAMPGISGLEATRIISEKYKNIAIIIFSGYTDDSHIAEALESGALGVLPKNTTKKELLDCIYAVNAGEEFLSQSISEQIIKTYVKNIKKPSAFLSNPNMDAKLSDREQEILKFITLGYSHKEIGDKMNIAVRTVESHKRNIMEKLNLHKIVDLVKYTIKTGIIEL